MYVYMYVYKGSENRRLRLIWLCVQPQPGGHLAAQQSTEFDVWLCAKWKSGGHLIIQQLAELDVWPWVQPESSHPAACKVSCVVAISARAWRAAF